VDAAGNVYIADTKDNAVKEWNAATQTLGTLVSSGLNGPQGVAVDAAGNVYIADTQDNAIKEWNAATQTLSTLVSSGLSGPQGVAVDASGNVYIADTGNSAIKVLPRAFVPGRPISERATAGSDALAAVLPANISLTRVFAPSSDQSWLTIGGVSGGVVNFSFTKNTGAARTADITLLGQQIAVTQAVAAGSDIITTIAGNGTRGYSGNGKLMTAAEFSDPAAVAVDAAGDIFIADYVNNCIREANAATGDMTTIAGNGTMGSSGDGGAATAAQLDEPAALALDSAGDIFIADDGGNRIREVKYTTNYATSTIITVAGDGKRGFSGDGGQATAAEFDRPSGVAVNATGTILYIADEWNNRIREVNLATGVITTVAGNGTGGYSGDGGQATAAKLDSPWALAMDSAGDLFIADVGNNRIREMNAATNVISTVAGDGTAGYSGNGGKATAAELDVPRGMAVDAAGDIFFADVNNNCVREVNYTLNYATSTITTIAGTGSGGYSGDGGPATAAELHYPEAVALDASGNLYVADMVNNRIREVAGATSSVSVTLNPAASTTTADSPAKGDGVAITATALNSAGTVNAGPALPTAVPSAGNLSRQVASLSSSAVAAGQAQAHDAALQSLNVPSPAEDDRAAAVWEFESNLSGGPSDLKEVRNAEAIDAILARFGE
jgi:DNA-binding beta-propeller fold protein YncE